MTIRLRDDHRAQIARVKLHAGRVGPSVRSPIGHFANWQPSLTGRSPLKSEKAGHRTRSNAQPTETYDAITHRHARHGGANARTRTRSWDARASGRTDPGGW